MTTYGVTQTGMKYHIKRPEPSINARPESLCHERITFETAIKPAIKPDAEDICYRCQVADEMRGYRTPSGEREVSGG